MKKNKVPLKEKLLLKVRKNPKKAVKVFLALLFSLGVLFGFVLGSFVSCSRSRKNAVTASADGGYSLGTPVNTYQEFNGVRYAYLGSWSIRSTYTYEIALCASVSREGGFGANYLCQINYVENYAPGNVFFNLGNKINNVTGSLPDGVSVGFESFGRTSLPARQAQNVEIDFTCTFENAGIYFNAAVRAVEHEVVLRVGITKHLSFPASFFYQSPPVFSLAGNYTPKPLPEVTQLTSSLPDFVLADNGLLYSQDEYNNAIMQARASGRSEGYQAGYSAGQNAGGKNNFLSLLTAAVDAPVKVFTSLLDVEILGFNMKNVMLSILSAALIVSIFRLFSSFGSGGS